MADRVVIIPPSEFLQGSPINSALLADLLAMAEAPPQAVDELSAALISKSSESALEITDLSALINSHLDEPFRDPAFNFLWRMSPDAAQGVFERLDAWRELSDSNAEVLSPQVLQASRRSIESLLSARDAANYAIKKEWLSTVTGDSVESIAFVCDARPVFNADKSSITGWTIITCMQIAAESQARSDQVIELVLREDQLEEIIEKARKAIDKIRVIEESLSSKKEEGV